MMGLAWSLPTGFNTPITYFYVVYFAALLMHRERRDHETCEKKWVLLKSFMMFADLNRLSAGMERTGKSTRSWCRGVSYHTYTEAKLDTKDCQISNFLRRSGDIDGAAKAAHHSCRRIPKLIKPPGPAILRGSRPVAPCP